MRVAGWEHALVVAIEKHAAAPFTYGQSDCLMLVADTILAVTGEDILAPHRGIYTTKNGAGRKLKEAGHADLGEAFAAILPEIPPSLAQRGDIGVIYRDGDIVSGVFTSFGFAGKSERGVAYEPITAVSRAFKVG